MDAIHLAAAGAPPATTCRHRAPAELEATGLSRSEAVRRGLVAAALRLRDRQRLIDEVAELAADEADRAEAADVAAMTEDLRAPG